MAKRDPRMVPLGYGKFVRADRVFALVPIEGAERRDGRRTYVHVDGLSEPVVASRSERAILADVETASPRRRAYRSAAQRGHDGAGEPALRSGTARGLPQLLDRCEHGGHGLLRVAEQQRGVLVVEERVVDAGEAGVHRALEHDHLPGLVHVEDRHAVDRGVLDIARGRVGHVVRADHERHVGLRELGVDLVHLLEMVVGHVGLGQQHVHVPGHAAGHRVDGVVHLARRASRARRPARARCAGPAPPPCRSREPPRPCRRTRAGWPRRPRRWSAPASARRRRRRRTPSRRRSRRR